MNKPFPKSLIQHECLTPLELLSLWELDPEELSRSGWFGLLALVEGILMERCPGFHAEHIPTRSSAKAEGYALILHCIHEENGFPPERIEKARKYLGFPHPPLTELLSVFFRTREAVRAHQLTQAQQRAA